MRIHLPGPSSQTQRDRTTSLLVAGVAALRALVILLFLVAEPPRIAEALDLARTFRTVATAGISHAPIEDPPKREPPSESFLPVEWKSTNLPPCRSARKPSERSAVNHFVGLSASHIVFLFIAALIAGALNSVAGGGSFISFPALLFIGMPPVNANATNTAAVLPGTVASTGAYWRQFTHETWRLLPALIVAASAGGLVGALVLLRTPQETFMKLVPWLLLAATLLFVLSERIGRWIQARTGRHKGLSRSRLAGGVFLQFCVSVYIGYFGAGVGTLILALLALVGIENIHAMNGMKTLLVSVGNAVALVTFIMAGAIFWPHAVLMAVGAAAGGYGGAHYAQKMSPRSVRQIIILVGLAMSAYFFFRH